MNTATNKLIMIIAADDQISKQMDQIAKNAEDKMGRVAKAGTGAASMMSRAFHGLVGVVTNIFHRMLQIGLAVFAALTAAATAFYAKSIRNALELQGSYVALAMVGKSLGIPGGALEAKVQEIRKVGIEWGAATQGLTYWLQAGLPISQVTAMARAAQDTAKAFSEISSVTFTEFINAIQSGWTQTLRKYGMYMPMEQVVRQYAPVGYKEANVNTLPQQIKQQAILNMLMEKTGLFINAYVTSQTLAVGLLKSMPRYVYELMTAVGVGALGPLHKVLVWATDFVKKLTEAAEQGRGLARPLLVAVSIIQAMTQSLGTGTAYAATLNIELDKVFNAKKAGEWAETIQNMISGFQFLVGLVEMLKTGVAGLFALIAWSWSFNLKMLGLKQASETMKNFADAMNDAAKESAVKANAAFAAATQSALKGPGVGAAAAKTFEELAKDIGGNFKAMMEALGLSKDATNANTAAINAAAEKDKTFGGGERFARYSQALGYRMARQGFAPIQVTVNGSAAYQQGAKDGIGALADALSQQLAGQFPTGLAGSGA